MNDYAELMGSERIIKYEQVIFALMREMGIAKANGDQAAYMNVLGVLVNMCKALGDKEGRDALNRISSIRARLKLELSKLAREALNDIHRARRKEAMKALEEMFAIIDSHLADAEEQIVYVTLWKLGIIQTNTPSTPSLEFLLKTTKESLLADLLRFSFVVGGQKQLEHVVEGAFNDRAK